MSIDSTLERPSAEPAAPEHTERPSEGRLRTGVPWATVLTLAVVLAYADGFWMTSLRGAVGAIERTQGPFTSWLRESTLGLPAYVVAVLAALTLSMRLFGPAPRKARLLATSLMVVAATTLVSVVAMTASSAYDYHLQAAKQAMIFAMGDACSVANCLGAGQDASFGLQVHAVLWGSLILLVTNLAAVAWVYAVRGGRLDVARIRRRNLSDRPAADRAPRTRLDDLRLLLVAGLVGSAVIHAAVVPEHQSEWPAAGVFFMVLAAAQLWLAAATVLSARPRHRVLLATAAISAGQLALWLFSRTAGMPFGPQAGIPEPVGLADAGAGLLELATLVVALVLLAARSRGLAGRPAASAHVRWLVVGMVATVTAVALAGSGLAPFDDLGTGANGHTTVTSSG